MSEEKIYELSARPDNRLSIKGKQLCIIIALASLLSSILTMLSHFSIMIALQGYTGISLSHINYGGKINPMKVFKKVKDPHSQFILLRLGNGKVALQADNGLYLSRINYGGDSGINPIEAAKKTIDPYSQFILIPLENGKVALQADNGLYLSRINYGGDGGINLIEAAKKTIDPYSQFILIPLENGKIALQADNGLYLSHINCSSIGANSVEAANKISDSCKQFAFPLPVTSGLLWNGRNQDN